MVEANGRPENGHDQQVTLQEIESVHMICDTEGSELKRCDTVFIIGLFGL